ncbi:MAG TPA: hypothetical protein DCY12_10670 [Candidatus Atribacteria bacterium]|nr:hypothetical protein [Candidatus Atribacteria bacterium]
MASDERVIVSRVGHPDTERLNWLEKILYKSGDSYRLLFESLPPDFFIIILGKNLRQAIDNAMEEKEGE